MHNSHALTTISYIHLFYTYIHQFSTPRDKLNTFGLRRRPSHTMESHGRPNVTGTAPHFQGHVGPEHPALLRNHLLL